jgi:hypothetical protein
MAVQPCMDDGQDTMFLHTADVACSFSRHKRWLLRMFQALVPYWHDGGIPVPATELPAAFHYLYVRHSCRHSCRHKCGYIASGRRAHFTDAQPPSQLDLRYERERRSWLRICRRRWSPSWQCQPGCR